MKKWFGLFVLILAVVLLLPSCAQPSPTTTTAPAVKSTSPPAPATPSATTPQYGGILKIIIPTGITILGAPSEVGTGGLYSLVGAPAIETLLRHDNSFRQKPRLAESYEIGPDGKSFTFHLRKGVKFHDGTDCNAAAVKYNLENYTPSGTRPNYFKVVTSYDTIDDYTIRLNLSAFSLDLWIQFAYGDGMICSPTALKTSTAPERMAKDHMVGTGAFRYVSHQRDVNAIFEKVNSYWQKGKPYVDGIQFQQIADPVTAVIALKSGDGQLLYLITAQQARDLEAAGYEIVRENLSPIGYITPDGANSDSPFSNKKVREAAEYAIDKKALAQGVGLGYYPVATQFAMLGYDNYSPELTPRNYDPKKAKQLLAEAGYTNGFKTTIYAPTSYNRDVLVVLQTYLKEVGIDATLDITDSTRLSSLQHTGWHGILVNSVPVNSALASKISMFFNADLTAYGNTMASVFRPPGWQDKLNAALTQYDENKRTAQTRELCKIMSEEVMGIPLWVAPQLSAQDKKLHNIKWAQGHGYFWEPENAWLSK